MNCNPKCYEDMGILALENISAIAGNEDNTFSGLTVINLSPIKIKNNLSPTEYRKIIFLRIGVCNILQLVNMVRRIIVNMVATYFCLRVVHTPVTHNGFTVATSERNSLCRALNAGCVLSPKSCQYHPILKMRATTNWRWRGQCVVRSIQVNAL